MEEFKKVKKFVEAFDDVRSAYREDLHELYHPLDYKYKKNDPIRSNNTRLQENWWNHNDESQYCARIVEFSDDRTAEEALYELERTIDNNTINQK